MWNHVKFSQMLNFTCFHMTSYDYVSHVWNDKPFRRHNMHIMVFDVKVLRLESCNDQYQLYGKLIIGTSTLALINHLPRTGSFDNWRSKFAKPIYTIIIMSKNDGPLPFTFQVFLCSSVIDTGTLLLSGCINSHANTALSSG
jgi:hypothetical protein